MCDAQWRYAVGAALFTIASKNSEKPLKILSALPSDLEVVCTALTAFTVFCERFFFLNNLQFYFALSSNVSIVEGCVEKVPLRPAYQSS